MSLTRKNNLNRSIGVIKQPYKPLRVFKQESAPFIVYKSPGKTNSQRLNIKDLLSPVQFRMVSTPAFYLGLKPVTCKSNQLAFASLMCSPEFLIRDLVDAVPNRVIGGFICPIRSKIHSI